MLKINSAEFLQYLLQFQIISAMSTLVTGPARQLYTYLILKITIMTRSSRNGKGKGGERGKGLRLRLSTIKKCPHMLKLDHRGLRISKGKFSWLVVGGMK